MGLIHDEFLVEDLAPQLNPNIMAGNQLDDQFQIITPWQVFVTFLGWLSDLQRSGIKRSRLESPGHHDRWSAAISG